MSPCRGDEPGTGLDALLAQARQEAARFFGPWSTDECGDGDGSDRGDDGPPVLAVRPAAAPCLHQAGGHQRDGGGADGLHASMVDASGRRFFKLLPDDDRARREVAWYGRCAAAAAAAAAAVKDDEAAAAAAATTAKHDAEATPKTTPHALAQLYREFMPRYHGVARVSGRWMLVLDDLFGPAEQGQGGEEQQQQQEEAAAASLSSGGGGVGGGSNGAPQQPSVRRCVLDAKLGRATGYPWGSPELIAKCARKDAGTTQAALGFRLCGVVCLLAGGRQQGGGGGGEKGAGADASDNAAAAFSSSSSAPRVVWREDRHWGKTLAGEADVRAALRRFAALGEEEQEEDAGEGEGEESGVCARRRRRRRQRLGGRRLAALAAAVGRLRACLARVDRVRLFSASALLLLERRVGGGGGRTSDENDDSGDDDGSQDGCSARVALVDFAHAFCFDGGDHDDDHDDAFEGPDANVLAGLDALKEQLLVAAKAAAKAAAPVVPRGVA